MRRFFVAVCVLAVGFGGFAALAATPAGAYSVPNPTFIDTIATASPGNGVADAVVNSAGDLVYSTANVVKFVPRNSGTYFGHQMAGGVTHTIAGNGVAGYSGDHAPADQSELNAPQGVAIDASGDVLIVDFDNNVVRVVPNHTTSYFGFPATAGDIYTLIGDGNPGYSGDGGPGSAAELQYPFDVAIDAATGNVLVTDGGNSVIRVWSRAAGTFYGQSMCARCLYTIAGTGILGYDGDGEGGPATSANLIIPAGLALDAAGDVLFSTGSRIRVVSESTHTVFGAATTAGNVYTVAGNGNFGYNGDDIPAVTAELWSPAGIDIDPDGNLLIADAYNCRIRAVAATTGTYYGQSFTANSIYTIAGNGTCANSGDGGIAADASLNHPTFAHLDAHGNAIIADTGNDRVRIVGAGNISTDDLTIRSSVSPSTLTPPSSESTLWTGTIYNGTHSNQSDLDLEFSIDAGSLNPNYYVNSTGFHCNFETATEAACDVDELHPGEGATVTLQIIAKGVAAPATIHANVQSDGSSSSDESDISIAAPIPGEVVSFATGQAGSPAIKTDKATSPANNIIAKFKIAKKVSAAEPLALRGASLAAAAAPLVNNAGTLVTLQRIPAVSAPGLCASGPACIGDVMTVAPFVNQTDPKHPATLTLTWDRSVSIGAFTSTALYWMTDAPGAPANLMHTCIKAKTGYTNLPCIKKIKAPTTKIGYTYTILILSSNDPSFGRK